MKTTQSSGTRPVHQTVAEGFEFKADGRTIGIEFTDQRLSPHAGSATFWGWLRPLDWTRRLAEALPHPLPVSNNHILPMEKASSSTLPIRLVGRKIDKQLRKIEFENLRREARLQGTFGAGRID